MPNRAKILAIDDEPDLIDLIYFHLARAGATKFVRRKMAGMRSRR